MACINLNNALKLYFELHNEKLRLVIVEGGQELACRKESFKKLKQFLSSEDEHLFKGRLQLIKQKNEIKIKVKGDIICTVSTAQFERALLSGDL